jgi:hypothetical protein
MAADEEVHGDAADAATVHAISTAIALITSCRHLPPLERGRLADLALAESRPELLVISLAQLALAYLTLCAQLVGVAPEALLEEVGLTYARQVGSGP